MNPAQVNYRGEFPYNGAPVGLYRATSTDVGSFPANAWGLYDMHGNVYEWCADWYDTYSGNLTSMTVDPTGGAGPGARVIRGGSWDNEAGFVRSAFRLFGGPTFSNLHIGFRLARPVTP